MLPWELLYYKYLLPKLIENHGASERFVVDLASPAEATMTLPMGESGNMASPHFADQFPAWSTGKPLPMTEPSATHQLTLTP